MQIHQALRTIRLFHGMTLNELAEHTGCSAIHLSRVESGVRPLGEVSLPRFLKMYSKAFGLIQMDICALAERIEKLEEPTTQAKMMCCATILNRKKEWGYF